VGKDLATFSGFEGLIALVKILRSKQGCPWDQAQTAEQIKGYLLEEAYEVLEAIDSQDGREICGELGDLLFHIVFLARIYEEKGVFDMGDVLNAITEKMIRRHPHVFGEKNVSGVGEVKDQWQKIKTQEKEGKTVGHFDSVPKTLPALMRAYRLAERAGRLGLAPTEPDKILGTLDKQYQQWKGHAIRGDRKKATSLLGDMLFSIVDAARLRSMHPEEALQEALALFLERYRYMEMELKKRGKPLEDLSPEERARLWEESGKRVKTG
jgi:MazG family protein